MLVSCLDPNRAKLDLVRAGGAQLYEAGVKLKDIIRGRAVLLLSDRTDIADAVEADGVALTGKGSFLWLPPFHLLCQQAFKIGSCDPV